MTLPEVTACVHCAAPLRGLIGQRRFLCPACGSQIWIETGSLPAVALQLTVDGGRAESMVRKEVRKAPFLDTFGRGCASTARSLLYVPVYQLRSVIGMWSRPRAAGEYRTMETETVELACDIEGLQAECLGEGVIEDCVHAGKPDPFDPATMRRQGTILMPAYPVPEPDPSAIGPGMNRIESQARLVYLPVWEVILEFEHLRFACYISAADGSIIQLHGIRSNHSRLLAALLGVFALAAVVTRGLKLIIFTAASILAGVSIFLALVGTPIVLLLIGMLAPYFWRLFSFKEEILISGESTRSRLLPVAGEQSAFPSLSRRLFQGLLGEENRWR